MGRNGGYYVASKTRHTVDSYIANHQIKTPFEMILARGRDRVARWTDFDI